MEAVTVTVTVRDCYGTLLPGIAVTVNAVPGGAPFCYCAGEDPQAGVTDGSGQVVVTYDEFGGCGQLSFTAQAGVALIGPSTAITIGSPDNSGDCQINLVDFGGFAQQYFSSSPCSDYNCDGTVNLVDFGTFAQHYFDTCP
jgi:hypothetical protein